MKKILLFLIYFATTSLFAQKTTFDVLKYAEPFGWQKDVSKDVIIYTKIDQNNWCRINMVKSTISKGNITDDFENEWQEMVVKSYNPITLPRIENSDDSNGWKIKVGAAKFSFNNQDAMVLLTTATGYNRCVSIVSTTNNKGFMNEIYAFLDTIDFLQQKSNTEKINTNSIIGTWCITSSDQSRDRIANGVVSTTFRQYTFNQNGTYICNIKTFDPLMNSIFLNRENGTYKITESNLTINPINSRFEEWSKKNNSDQWGKLLKTQKVALEKVTYSYEKIYIPEINEWQLIFKSSHQTKRDGFFNNYEHNAWIYILASTARPIIKLPEN